MKKIFLIILFSLVISYSCAYAIPDLQVYIPGAIADTRGEDEETWFFDTYGVGYFDLYIVGCFGTNVNNMADKITSGRLLVTAPQGASFSISGLGAGTPHNDLSFLSPLSISPSLNHYPLNKPDLYDFYTYDIGSFSKTTTGLWNYDATDGSKSLNPNAVGEEKIFNISCSEDIYLHFDAYAQFEDDELFSWRANPGSHDVSTYRTPEPASLSLLGLGILGLFGIRRKRRRKEK